MSISEREGHSAGVEVYSPFLDLVTASCWEAGTCGRSPSVLWIYQEEEINILSGQLEYVPMLKNAQAIYTAHAGRVCLRGFFLWFWLVWLVVVFCFVLFFSPVWQPIMTEAVNRTSLNQSIISQVLSNASAWQLGSLRQHLSLTAWGFPSVILIMQKDQEIASYDTTESSQFLFDQRLKRVKIPLTTFTLLLSLLFSTLGLSLEFEEKAKYI